MHQRAMGVIGAEDDEPRHKCFVCGRFFYVNRVKVNGIPIGPSASCADCFTAMLKAGRWQEVSRWETARQIEKERRERR